MATTTCKACGGTVTFSEGSTVGLCEYCGSTVTRSKIEDEQRDSLHNRGNLLRMRGEYDRALSVFEQIIALDDTDAEAHWNAALCRYGIEYVKDPDTNKRIPTCHRASWDSILTDVDYLDAVKYADYMARRVYEADGKYIDEVQKQILAISHTEDPYDIFICYKESALDGSRTKDSVLAQDLYDYLTKEGYRVFFARISLEDTLGKQYEPYIFSALNSAKVMLVVGTSADNINSPWVRNEWSRFLSLVKKDPSKVIIPCYRDMDPYDLPDELAVLQSQNMGKIGFDQDLMRGISKIFSNKSIQNPKENTSIGSTTSPLLRRAYMFLSDHDWGSAESYFNRVLDLAPECGEAYAGLLCVEYKADALNNLAQYVSPLHLDEERVLQQTKTQKAIMEAQARAEGRRLQGYTYQEERAFDVAELTAQNESVAGIANIGTGLGMIGGMAMGVGGAVAGITGEALRPISNVPDLTQAQPIPAQQPAPPPLSATAFPENDAAGTTQQGPVQTAPSQPIEGIKERMEKLNSIKDLIPEEVYQAKLKEILDSV